MRGQLIHLTSYLINYSQDPDAPHRQMKSLDDLDKDDEHFLLKHLFWCLRAGQIDMVSFDFS